MHMINDTFIELRDAGVRVTPQRQAIFQYLKETTSHPRAEDVYEYIRQKFPGISLATVYNTLNLLVEKGLIRQLTYGDMSSRFDGVCEQHYHLVCDDCGQLVDVMDVELPDELHAKVQDRTGFKVRTHRLELYGLCPECQTKAEKSSTTAM